MPKKYNMGKSNGGSFNYQCPNCSNIQADPIKHKYNIVKFEVGETEAKCSKCGAILIREIGS